jgi:LruC domain-containing protein
MLHVSAAGTAPHGIVIPGKWQWPVERMRVTEAYPDFGKWASDHTQAKDWYKRPEQGKVVNNK